jgi:hypothetical protein
MPYTDPKSALGICPADNFEGDAAFRYATRWWLLRKVTFARLKWDPAGFAAREASSFGHDRDRKQAIRPLVEGQRIVGRDAVAFALPIAQGRPRQVREQPGSPVRLQFGVKDFHRCSQC